MVDVLFEDEDENDVRSESEGILNRGFRVRLGYDSMLDAKISPV